MLFVGRVDGGCCSELFYSGRFADLIRREVEHTNISTIFVELVRTKATCRATAGSTSASNGTQTREKRSLSKPTEVNLDLTGYGLTQFRQVLADSC